MVTLTGTTLTPEQLLAVVDGEPVEVDPAAWARVRAAREVVLSVLAHRPVYGRTTGVGANLSVAVDADAGARLLRSHAGGAGPVVDARAARAMLVVRVNQLLAGGAGVEPALIEILVVAVNNGAHPTLHSIGSIGTGDLTAMAELALTVRGDRPWIGSGPPPYVIDNLDALALLSSSALTIASAALTYRETARLADTAMVVAGLTAVGLSASVEPFAAAVAQGRPHTGSTTVAGRMRALLDPAPTPSGRIQDPYGLRALASVHGVLLDALDRLGAVLVIELNAAGENPLVSVEASDVFHHGSFHQAPLAAALDAVRLALLSSAQLGSARLSALLEPRLTGLTAFLADGPAGSSGLMITEYTAASALASIRAAAAPVAGSAIVISRGAEEHASFASQAVHQAIDQLAYYRVAIAIELVAAVRALRMSGHRPASGELQAAFAAAGALPAELGDRPLDGDIAIAVDLLDSLGRSS